MKYLGLITIIFTALLAGGSTFIPTPSVFDTGTFATRWIHATTEINQVNGSARHDEVSFDRSVEEVGQ